MQKTQFFTISQIRETAILMDFAIFIKIARFRENL